MIMAAQCKMARAGLGWSVDRLAKEARVGAATVARFESGKGEAIPATVAAMRYALEAAGIEFLPDNGVRLTAEAEPKAGPTRAVDKLAQLRALRNEAMQGPHGG